MKTYILSTLDRIKQYSKTLDAKAILYNKNWEVFNDLGEKEVLIFRPKNELLIVRQGIVQRSKWELLPMGALLIETDTATYLFNAAFVDNNFLAMQLDGTDECMLMVESNCMKQLALNSIDGINEYLKSTYISKETSEEKHILHENGIKQDDNAIYIIIAFIALIFIVLTILGYATS